MIQFSTTLGHLGWLSLKMDLCQAVAHSKPVLKPKNIDLTVVKSPFRYNQTPVEKWSPWPPALKLAAYCVFLQGASPVPCKHTSVVNLKKKVYRISFEKAVVRINEKNGVKAMGWIGFKKSKLISTVG